MEKKLEIIGAFVRVPLRAGAVDQYLRAIHSGESLEAEAIALEAGILAVGTPVTGGDLPTEVVRIRERGADINLPWIYLKTPPSDQDASEYELEVERLLTHEQAQAQIAALEAEVAELHEAEVLARASTEASISRLTSLLREFRDAAAAEVTATGHSSHYPFRSHHHPIWTRVADALEGGER